MSDEEERRRARRAREGAKELADLLAGRKPIPHYLLVDQGMSRPPTYGYWRAPKTEMWNFGPRARDVP